MNKAYFASLILHVLLLAGLSLRSFWHSPTPLTTTAIVTFEFVESSDTPGVAQSRLLQKQPSFKQAHPLKHPPDQALAQNQEEAQTQSSSNPVGKDGEQSSVVKTASGPSGQGLQLSYAQQLKAYIEEHKHYPRAARKLRQSGLVRLQVEIDQAGRFQKIQILEASQHAFLNQAALNLIESLQKFKPLPDEVKAPAAFTIPIAYQLTGSEL